MKSCVGVIPLTEKQADRLELPSHSQISPLLEKCCLRLSANESYQNALSRNFGSNGNEGRSYYTTPTACSAQNSRLLMHSQAVTEVSVDGGKVRLRSETGAGSQWLEYKAVRLQGIYYNSAFHDNQSVIDWVNSHASC